MQEKETATISKIISFVRELADPKDLASVSSIVFKDSSISTEEGLRKLGESVEYYETFYSSREAVPHLGLNYNPPAIYKLAFAAAI